MGPQTSRKKLKLSLGRCRWLARTGWALMLTCTAPTIVQATPPQHSQLHNTYYTQADFTLPFQVKPGGRCPQSLDLMVSRDGGRSWQVHQSLAPAEGRFRFTQADEGAYWLKVQVRDAAGSSVSPTTMHLIVDRSRPQARLVCDWQGENKLMVSTHVEDANLDPESIQLLLRTDVDLTPQTIALQGSGTSAEIAEGQSLIEMSACKSFELRLSARDRAGNRIVNSERFFHPILAGEQDALLPAFEEPPFPAKRTFDSIDSDDLWTAIEIGKPTNITKTQLVAVAKDNSVVRNRSGKDSPPIELVPPAKPSVTIASEQQLTELPITEELSLDPPLSSAPSVPHVQSPSKKLQIQYQLKETVPTDQLHVELWVTPDAGETWEFWGLDRDAQSPAAVEVDNDGTFGFCVVCVHSDADLQYRPKAGDKPDLLVTVKQPEVKRRLQAAAKD